MNENHPIWITFETVKNSALPFYLEFLGERRLIEDIDIDDEKIICSAPCNEGDQDERTG